MPHEIVKFPIANDPRLIEAMQADEDLRELRRKLLSAVVKYRYTYNFSWYGRPIIQMPEDVLALQEIILSTKPDLIVETGVAHGGSLVFSASMLELMGSGEALGIDIDIRPHNRTALEEHRLRGRIRLIQGSSIDPAIAAQVQALAKTKQRVMVVLDSNHTHAHVEKELELYSPLVTKGNYLVVLDTAIEDLPDELYPDRPWGKGNNPKTAVWNFLKSNDRFAIDRQIENRLLASVAPDGYLRCIKD
jgi:cephalosporin hydroxylase